MENEVKFKVKEVKKILDLLANLGAKRHPKEQETDYSFDTPDGFLSRQGKLLRLRKIRNKALLTFKGRVIVSRFKKREEMNIELNDFSAIWKLLHQIGFIGSFSKEKVRQGFRCRNMDVFLDKLPFIGYYLEIEGKDRNIIDLAKKLGFLHVNEAIKESYNQLFNLFCIVNQDKIKHAKKKIEFSFKCEKEFRKYYAVHADKR